MRAAMRGDPHPPLRGATLTRRCAAALSQKERAGAALVRRSWIPAYAVRAVMGGFPA